MNVAAAGLAFSMCLGGWALAAELPTPPFPPEMRLEPLPEKAPEPPENPSTPEKIALGRLLFFDPVLSATQNVACATCHHPTHGWADGRATPIGVGGNGLGPARLLDTAHGFAPLKRNTPTLLNVAFNGVVAGTKSDPDNAPMFWDARVQGLEAQVLVPLRSHEEMRGDACTWAEAPAQAVQRIKGVQAYVERFRTAFPTDPVVTEAHLTQAIATFERSLLTPDTPYDRFLRGDSSALNPEQRLGLRVFQDAGCIQCHGGPMLSDFKLHFLGVSDETSSERRTFRTPSLRNLKFTAPYMHDGSQRTLEEVLKFYEELMDAVSESAGQTSPIAPPLDPLLGKLNLKAEDFPALEAFLQALNADHYDQSTPETVPSGLPVPK